MYMLRRVEKKNEQQTVFFVHTTKKNISNINKSFLTVTRDDVVPMLKFTDIGNNVTLISKMGTFVPSTRVRTRCVFKSPFISFTILWSMEKKNETSRLLYTTISSSLKLFFLVRKMN